MSIGEHGEGILFMDIKQIDLKEFFGNQGMLGREMPRYEARESQGLMAQAVAAALEKEQHLIVEADTGVGKSLAYLVPGIFWAVTGQKKLVISTNTINLQEQLLDKDLPLLKKIMPFSFEAVLVKGRRNYLCWRRWRRIIEDEAGMLIPSEYSEDLEILKDWVQKTDGGSRADMERQPPAQLWSEISCETDNCSGQKCPFYDICFLQKARARLYQADILVVNHHLFFSDLVLRQIGKNLLPEYDAVILDEAHFTEGVATEHLGFQVTSLGVKYLLSKLYNPRTVRGLLIYLQASRGVQLIGELHRLAGKFFGGLARRLQQNEGGIIRLTEPEGIPDIMGPKLAELYQELRDIKDKQKGSNDLFQELNAYIRRTGDLMENLNIFRKQTLIGHVYWIEQDEGRYRRVLLKAYPVVVSNQLKTILFHNIKTVILTGATLSVGKSFQYFKTQLGIDAPGEIRELRLGSSFNYQEQIKIYVPGAMPSPKEENKYKKALGEQICRYINYTGGKAFVLFTNTKLMNEIYDKIAPKLERKGINCFIQGSGVPRHIMLQRFREDINSVLFGTDSFWTGVDVEGEALSNVIITRLPFAVPQHPLMQARIKYIEEHGGNAFRDYSLPQAVLKLRQGAGRLVRSRTDKGIIVILDNRIINSFYGKEFWASLPECPRVIE